MYSPQLWVFIKQETVHPNVAESALFFLAVFSDPDPHYKISWIQVRMENADPDPGGNTKSVPEVTTELSELERPK